MSPDLRAEIDEVLACDDRVMAWTFTWRGTSTDGGGPFEVAMGGVRVVENGLGVRTELFDHDDRQAMTARYVELGGGQGPLGDRPPERVYRQLLRLFARQDVGAVVDFLTDDFVMVDHRILGWTETDKQGELTAIETMFAAALDVRLEVDEVLACDDRLIITLHVFRGHSADGGGEFEIANGMVIEVVEGRMRRPDRYEYDDREAMLTRYAELGGHRAILGDSPPERHFAEVTQRLAARDVESLVALYAQDHVRVDHRTIGWEEIRQDGERAHWESIFAMSPDLRAETDEVLACDDRVMAWTFRWHGTDGAGGGPFEVAMGGVRVVENGVGVRTELFDHDDRQAMIARYTELGGGLAALGDRPPEQSIKEMFRLFAPGDVDGFIGLCAADHVVVDHRTLGWSETDRQGYRGIVESMLSASLDVRVEVDEVLACDDRVIAGCFAWRGHSVDGGGTSEIPMGVVMLVEDGLVRRIERYEPEDRRACSPATPSSQANRPSRSATAHRNVSWPSSSGAPMPATSTGSLSCSPTTTS